MKLSKGIFALFIFFPIFLFGHLVYGLVVREPFPSFMMPGFSRIDNDGATYVLIDRNVVAITSDGVEHELSLKELSPHFSKIALSRIIDLVYFDATKNYNSKQKGYYQIIEKYLGTQNYQKYVLSVRNPNMTAEEKVKFNDWLKQQVVDAVKSEPTKITIIQTEVERSFVTGEVIQSNTLNTANLPL